MSITAAEFCPQCAGALTRLPENEPWCGACEWNLDAFPVDEDASWFWRRIVALDRRAGFRAHRELATSEPEEPGRGAAYRVLVVLSGLLVLADLVAAGFGLWLLIWGDLLFPKLGGVVLLALAWGFRPRLGRVRDLLNEYTFVLERRRTPTLHRLISEVAAEVGVPVPDRILLDFQGNAGVSVVGFRRTSILTLGVPLLVALRPQELVALIGHELGHLKYEDSTRALLIQPARTAFGRLSVMFRPPLEVGEIGGLVAGFHLVARLVGGLLSLVFASVHTWIAVLAAEGDRRVELRADTMAARAGGSEAALSVIDVLATLESIFRFIQPYVPVGEAGATWRRLIRTVREREAGDCSAWRQLTIRTGASLLVSHPPAGRRHQWLAARPPQPAGIEVDGVMAALLERELDPYADALHRRMTDHPAFWQG